MAGSSQVRAEDMRAVLTTVGECLEQWDDPKAWMHHLLTQSSALAGTDLASLILATPHPDPLQMTWRDREVIGLDDDVAKRSFHDVGTRDIPDMPGADIIGRDILASGASTRRLEELGGLDLFHSTVSYENVHAATGMCDYVACFRMLPQIGMMAVATTSKTNTRRAISARGVAVTRLLWDEMQPLIGTRLATLDQPSRHGLSPRLVQTLDALLDGLSEKHAAARLGISPTTIHQYVGTLYRHFGVESRAELMSYFIKRQPVRPQ
ncbi:MAG: helix-turn-helix transcriptional regulator [Planctomycetota bacterium]